MDNLHALAKQYLRMQQICKGMQQLHKITLSAPLFIPLPIATASGSGVAVRISSTKIPRFASRTDSWRSSSYQYIRHTHTFVYHYKTIVYILENTQEDRLVDIDTFPSQLDTVLLTKKLARGISVILVVHPFLCPRRKS